MARTEVQQAQAILKAAHSILLIVPERPSLDAIASMMALNLSLTAETPHTPSSLQRHIDQVSPSHVPTPLQFLAGSSQVKTSTTEQPELVIDIVGPNALEGVRTQQLATGLRLHLSFPPSTTLTKDAVETTVRVLPYDTVITIGATDLEELGGIFTNHADFFYRTPMINIDHRAANEHYGTVNLVDITAGSCAEVTYHLIATITPAITTDIATALYAGIIAGTDSFQNPATTPRSFQVAANLIEQDADREAVIQNLVKTKPLKLIKLAGLVYARLRYESGVNLYWTTLAAQDFTTNEATTADIPAVMTELTNNIAGFNAAFLLYEDTDSNRNQPPARRSKTNRYVVYLLLGKGLAQRRAEIQSILTAKKVNGALTFDIPAQSIEAAERVAHEKIKQILP